ncbi:hydroxyurea phosphotransferase [Streptomyces pactum]|uniref:Hydroxyurea phosphotransferase n=1 Tax=Streptomyces pactum TaxID=68249 RepID=A0ABS0NL12_9ACTN|nr:aminoglycoside phosphotransferase family protein [Streptomyces pactum]MBH5335872.1 hydroxyurea phosphotransferase [Streptomyces pactum]
MTRIEVPGRLAAYYEDYAGGPEWIAALPELITEFLERWDLRPDGAPAHGHAALVLPVTGKDGTPAAVKFQQVTEETAGEAAGLRAWAGQGAVRLLDHDPASGTMLLERLDARRSLASVPDDQAALLKLAELMARLTGTPAPDGLRTLAGITDALLDEVPGLLERVADADHRRLLESCLAAVREVRGEPGDRLLHWDLHYENVLAPLPGSGRGPWLAIDPKPLAGDPGFELLPALYNRWDDVLATGDTARAVRRRFDLLTEITGQERQRALRWTLARVLENAAWELRDEDPELPEEHLVIAGTLLAAAGD